MGILKQNEIPIIQEYLNEGLSNELIGKKYNCSDETVRRFIIKYNLKRLPSKKSLLENNKENVINLLNTFNVTLKDIASKYNVSMTTLNTFLKENNISTIKNRSKLDLNLIRKMYYEENKNIHDIGKYFNVTAKVIIGILKDNNLPVKKSGQQHWYKEDYFENINNEYSAYYLGLLTADGCIHGNQIILNLQSSDKIVINYFIDSVVTSGKKPKGHLIERDIGQDMYGITITNKKIADDLRTLGIIENKSKIIGAIPIELIQENVLHHYIRGLFDGDGSVWLSKNNNFGIHFGSASKKMIESYQNICLDKIKISYHDIYLNTIYQCQWCSIKDVIKFFNYIYYDATIYLPRKYNKFLEIFKAKENTEEIIIPKKILTP